MYGKQGLRRSAAIVLLLFWALLVTPSAFSGEWRVAPIRVEMSSSIRTAGITVMNEKPERTVLQANLLEWSQDENGADRYTETQDLVFFPKILAFETAGEKQIRIGMKGSAGEQEKTYRLYIEEIPDPRKKDRGVSVLVALRFGLPIFVKPGQARSNLVLQKFDLSRREARVLLKNAGNVSSVVRRVVFSGRNTAGDTVFTEELNGWYLLAGASRRYSSFIPADVCLRLSDLNIMVEADSGNLEGNLDVVKSVCSP